jgi:hypothetical protein
MAVALEHLTADVSGKGFDHLLTNARILSQLRDECVPHVIHPVAQQVVDYHGVRPLCDHYVESEASYFSRHSA